MRMMSQQTTGRLKAAVHCNIGFHGGTRVAAGIPANASTGNPALVPTVLPPLVPRQLAPWAFSAFMLVVGFLLTVPAARGDTLGQARFSWEVVADPVIRGYKVHWGTESGVYTHRLDAGNVSEVIVADFTDGGRYFAAVTAYSSAGEESDYSTELSFIYDTTARVILLEAEDGELTPPMKIFTDGSIAWVAASSADSSATTTLNFTAPFAAKFYIWTRVFAPSANRDSLKVTVDQEAALDYHIYGEVSPPVAAYQSEWTWSRIQISPGTPQAFALDGGPHRIRFGYWEDALLDRVVIVGNPDFVPTDELPHGGDFVAVIDQPQDARVAVGDSVTFSATVVATGPATLQWLHAGIAISTECGTSLTLPGVQQDHSGPYSLSAMCATATVSTRSATLSVIPPNIPTPFGVRNLSITAEGQVTIRFEGALGTEIGVYASSDLVNWSLIASIENTGNTLTVSDPEAIAATARFYRLGDIGRP